jgi:hypothetical protein
MNYVFMDQYRGFYETLIPLASTSFLVGENSTGKTSFLFLVDLLSKPEFWFTSITPQRFFSRLGGFRDIVSPLSTRPGSFTVGALATGTTNKTSNKSQSASRCRFTLIRFRDLDGAPHIDSYLSYRDGTITTILFQRGSKVSFHR